MYSGVTVLRPRNAIYVNNYAIDGTVVQNLLMEDSLVPTTVSILQSFCTI